MCGLSGIMSSTLSFSEENTFRDLLNVSSLRGVEGSGVIVAQREILKANPKIVDLKTTQIAGALAYSEKLFELLKPRCSIIAGHARWPTKGGVDINAVHPHRCEHIIGVHNGTMHKVAGEDVKDRSDSAMLFESFAKIGVEETIKNSDGAYALVWIDEKDQTLNFLRNGQRTLYFKNVGWQKNINTLSWSSEQEMLDFVYKRNYRGNNTWDTYLPTDTWFKYPLDVKHIIIPEEVKTDIKPVPKIYPVGEYRGYRGHGGSNYRSALYDDVSADDLPWEHLSGPRRGDNVTPLLPRPGMTQKEHQKLARQVAKEEAKRRRRLEQFRGVNSTTPRDITPFLSEEIAPDEDDRYLKLEGKECAWCGSGAAAGDTVFPVGGGFVRNSKEFICHDCSRNPDAAVWIEHTFACTVIN